MAGQAFLEYVYQGFKKGKY